MKAIKILPVIIIIAGLLSACRALYYNLPDLTDYHIFPYREIKHDPENVFHFIRPDIPLNLGKKICTNYYYLSPDAMPLDDYLDHSKTAAFIIIRNDTLLYEHYCKSYLEESLFNTFSVTKAFVTTLVGIALDKGAIKSINQPVTDFLPDLKTNPEYGNITIRHLLLHTAGFHFSDTKYSPFSDNARFYYGKDLRKEVRKTDIEKCAGTCTNYNSVNTQLLIEVLEKATGESCSSYLEQNLWKKIGMQYDALWNLDNNSENGIEKGFACFNCRAIDMAKLGRLYLNNGTFEGERIVSPEFIHDAIKRDTTDGSHCSFQYNFNIGPKLYGIYYASGLYGQLIFVCPVKNMIIIRTGERNTKYNPQFIRLTMMQIVDQL